MKRIPIEDSFDLHSFPPREVVPAASDYLDAAREAGIAEVRLIHGKGTGAQRAAIQRLLRDHPLVETYWDAPESHLGATIVRLKHQPA